jgi:hypothetical protein
MRPYLWFNVRIFYHLTFIFFIILFFLFILFHLRLLSLLFRPSAAFSLLPVVRSVLWRIFTGQITSEVNPVLELQGLRRGSTSEKEDPYVTIYILAFIREGGVVPWSRGPAADFVLEHTSQVFW